MGRKFENIWVQVHGFTRVVQHSDLKQPRRMISLNVYQTVPKQNDPKREKCHFGEHPGGPNAQN